jgi:hypothetical protein
MPLDGVRGRLRQIQAPGTAVDHLYTVLLRLEGATKLYSTACRESQRVISCIESEKDGCRFYGQTKWDASNLNPGRYQAAQATSKIAR